MNDHDQELLDRALYGDMYCWDDPRQPPAWPSPYGQVTPGRLIEPGWRCTAFYYATHRGLPVTFGYLLELGRRAAGLARWYGLGRAMVWEGPFWVHTWPEETWLEAAASLARDWPAAAARVFPPYPVPPPPPLYVPRAADPEHPHGYQSAGDYS